MEKHKWLYIFLHTPEDYLKNLLNIMLSQPIKRET